LVPNQQLYSNAPYVGRLNIKERLTKKHSEYLATMPGMRQLKIFTEGSLEKLSRDLLASDRNQ
jgi:hypothetical protein